MLARPVAGVHFCASQESTDPFGGAIVLWKDLQANERILPSHLRRAFSRVAQFISLLTQEIVNQRAHHGGILRWPGHSSVLEALKLRLKPLYSWLHRKALEQFFECSSFHGVR